MRTPKIIYVEIERPKVNCLFSFTSKKRANRWKSKDSRVVKFVRAD